MYCMTQNVVANDEAVTGSKHRLFSSISDTFERYVTNLRGTFVLVPISTHPNVYIVDNIVSNNYAKLQL
jgi:hypothetical protein